MRSFHCPDDFLPRTVCFPSDSMASPISPTYTSYSAPSPYSSGSSASLPTSSPISEPFESVSGSEQHTGVVVDYVGYAPSSGSLPAYANMAYIPANSTHNHGYNLTNWSTPDIDIPAKRQPVSSPSHQPQQYQQYSHYQHTPSQSPPDEMNALVGFYVPSALTTFHHRPQHEHSTTTIHSPVPIPASSHIPLYESPSLSSNSANSASVIQSHAQRVHPPQRINYPPIQSDALFDIDIEEWHTSPHSTNSRHFSPIYSHSRSHSLPTSHGHPLSGRDFTPQQPQHQRQGGSDQHCGPITVKQEDPEIRHPPTPPQHSTHTINLPVPHEGQMASHVHRPHLESTVLPVSRYSGRQQNHEQFQLSVLYPERQAYAMQPSVLCSRNSSQPRYGVTSSPEIGYTTQYHMPAGGYGSASGESPYADVCDPQLMGRNNGEEIRHGISGVVEDQWDAVRRGVGGEAALFSEGGETRMAWEDINADADAEGDDDSEVRGPSGYTGQRTDTNLQLSDNSDSPGEYQPRCELTSEGDDGEDEEEEAESEEDDSRDPEFVMRRPRRAYSSSYPSTEFRHLRSSRFTPYPSVSPTLPPSNVRYINEVELQEQEQCETPGQHFRSRRSYSHSNPSMSPPICEPYTSISADGSGTMRRRARPSATVPLPIPVPNLTKKSRGRRVPTMEEFRAEAVTIVKSGNSRKKGAPTPSSKATRTYTCDVDGCGKLFARGEHLKRHVRSIHTYEKRQSFDVFFLGFFCVC